jgi:hypothetical protein
MKKGIIIQVPEGYEIDKENSTFENIVFKEIEKEFDFKTIKSFEDALKHITKGHIKDMKNLYNSYNNNIFKKLLKDEVSYIKRKIIVQAINNGWEPNWQDINQRKWFPAFSLSPRFVFLGSDYACTYTSMGVSSCLYSQSKEKSDYFGKNFIELHKDFLF